MPVDQLSTLCTLGPSQTLRAAGGRWRWKPGCNLVPAAPAYRCLEEASHALEKQLEALTMECSAVVSELVQSRGGWEARGGAGCFRASGGSGLSRAGGKAECGQPRRRGGHSRQEEERG